MNPLVADLSGFMSGFWWAERKPDMSSLPKINNLKSLCRVCQVFIGGDASNETSSDEPTLTALHAHSSPVADNPAILLI